MKYENEICQGCGKIMNEGDDVVFCPVCGTPQHRECYMKENKCVNEHLHSEDFEWKPKHDFENVPQKNTDTKNSVRCPFCGYENKSEAEICENCGQIFVLNDTKLYMPTEDNVEIPVLQGENGGFNFRGQIFEEKIEGVKTDDLLLYLKSEPVKYYEKFCKIQKGKLTFNWAAFIFAPFWYFFRKLYKPGIIFMTIFFIMNMFMTNPVNDYVEVFNEISASDEYKQMLGEAILGETGVHDEKTTQQFNALFESLNENMKYFGIYYGVQLILRLFIALTADRWYKKKAIRDINEVNKSAQNAPNPQQAKYIGFVRNGSISLGNVCIAYLAQYVLSLIVNMITS